VAGMGQSRGQTPGGLGQIGIVVYRGRFDKNGVFAWSDQHRTLVACGRAGVHEERYLAALLGATRWRREERTLILENDTDVLRFQLAPF